MKFYYLEPEVGGGLGRHCIIDRASGKTSTVLKLHYEFDGWLGDEILESTPCFIVSGKLAEMIERVRLSGVKFDDVEITTSDEFAQLYPDCRLPNFAWLKIFGQAGRDDFGVAPDLRLVVSDKAMKLLKGFEISHASVEAFPQSAEVE